jgi:hypothetical protein
MNGSASLFARCAVEPRLSANRPSIPNSPVAFSSITKLRSFLSYSENHGSFKPDAALLPLDLDALTTFRRWQGLCPNGSTDPTTTEMSSQPSRAVVDLTLLLISVALIGLAVYFAFCCELNIAIALPFAQRG